MHPPVTALHSRGDWAFVKFAYVPALVAAIVIAKLFWVTAAVAIRVSINYCGICRFLDMWGNHVEEWYNAKPLMSIQDWGLTYENGSEIQEYEWSRITGVVMHRRIPMWRTNGTPFVAPPYWLSIRIDEEPEMIVINTWPRAVDGGLMRLYRFGRELQERLTAYAARSALDSPKAPASVAAR